jgi:Flp pilus assembly protein TadD
MAMMTQRMVPLLAAVALTALGGCAHGGDGPRAEEASLAPIDRNARAAVERTDILNQMTFWAREYAERPQDLEAAQKFADALRRGGRATRAAQVAQESLRVHRQDPVLLRTLGLAQIAAGQPNEALRPLAMLAVADAADWRARSALGVALDQLGRGEEARAAYREALDIKPDEPGVLTNLGVSLLGLGDAAEAELVLRQASVLPDAPPEARQNLAIALGLQGKFEEAEQVLRVDLPPAVVSANLAYLRSLRSDPRSWDALGSLRGTGAGAGRTGR